MKKDISRREIEPKPAKEQDKPTICPIFNCHTNLCGKNVTSAQPGLNVNIEKETKSYLPHLQYDFDDLVAHKEQIHS